jgi:hypothetical protein
VPGAGDQTDEVLLGLGYRPDEIGAIRACGVLA